METQSLLSDHITEVDDTNRVPSPKPSTSHPATPQDEHAERSDLPGLVVTYSMPESYQNGAGWSMQDEANDSQLAQKESKENEVIRVYPIRWYILIVFSFTNFMQGGLCVSWTVISESAEAAYGWTDGTMSMLVAWLYILYLVSILPFTWLMDKKGLRLTVNIGAVLLFLGTFVRCFPVENPFYTWIAHISNVIIGLSGPVIFTAGPILSSLWFPPDGRATATAVMTLSGFMGGAMWFLAGPALVEAPKVANSSHIDGIVEIFFSNNTSSIFLQETPYANIDAIKSDMLHYHYGECALCFLLMVLVAVYFPAKPPSPPSKSASLEKTHFLEGFKKCASKENRNFWLVGIVFGITNGIVGVWYSLMDVNLGKIGISQQEADLLGCVGIIVGCVVAVIGGRLADKFQGHMKMMSVILITGSIVSTLAFLLVANQYVAMSRPVLYASSIGVGLCTYAAQPLYYELAIETCYPITEVVTSGMMSILFNAFPLFFLILFLFPSIGTSWMNWALFGSLIFCFPLMLLFREDYKRLNIDTQPPNPTGIEVEGEEEPGCSYSINSA